MCFYVGSVARVDIRGATGRSPPLRGSMLKTLFSFVCAQNLPPMKSNFRQKMKYEFIPHATNIASRRSLKISTTRYDFRLQDIAKMIKFTLLLLIREVPEYCERRRRELLYVLKLLTLLKLPKILKHF